MNEGWLFSENDELVERLRGLRWPQAQPELRERCWKEFSRMIGERQERAPEARRDWAVDAGQRYACSRRREPVRTTVAQSWSILHAPRAVLGHRPALSIAA